MKKLQNAILSVLMLSFAFVVLHDFALQEHSSATVTVVSMEQQSSLDLAEKIHKSIHTLVALQSEEPLYFVEIPIILKPNYIISFHSSNNNCVLERPPHS
jgi:hypothetical protein